MFEWIEKVIAGMIVLFLSIILGGFVFKSLWSWFFVTTFKLPELSIASAIGISLVIGWLTETAEDIKDDEFWESILTSIVKVLLIWGTGWIIYQFM